MCLRPIWLDKKGIYVPCGHCKACYLKATYDWAHRIMVESAAHTDSCVVVLTYDEEHVPFDGLLNYRHVQLFHKRLRKAIGSFRFFCSCEYGDEHGRPHYHDILFGYKPNDLQYMFSRHGNKFYRSDFLNAVWSKGFATVGTLTEKSAFYCAKYLQKLNFSDKLVPPTVHMSLKPGIGDFGYDSESMLRTRRLYLNGHAYSLPRYYLKKLYADYPDVFDDWYKAGVKASMRNVMRGVSSRDVIKRENVTKKFLRKYLLKY